MNPSKLASTLPFETPLIGVLASHPIVARYEWGLVGNNEHLMQWYEKETTLLESMISFLRPAFLGNQAALVIATKEHKEALELRLAASGIDVEAQRRSGKYISFDPSDRMEKFIIGGSPNTTLFGEVLGSLAAKAIKAFGGVRIFSEMVAVLLEQGHVLVARELEELWNDLAKTHSFTLFCAYPLHRRSSDLAGKLLTVV